VKKYDPNRLLQYESNTWQKDITEDISFLDVISRMYASVEWVEEYCEEQLYEYDNYCGGFVWEWCDHAVYAGEAENGKKKFLYGGDFGEFPHDGNFCMDGLVYPDRRVHIGLLEFLDFYMTWHIFRDGSIKASMRGIRNNNMPYHPRFGLKLLLPKTYQ
jgi:beta-galactosidase